MTIYPNAIDNDSTIIRVDDNITETGGDAINQTRSAIFAVEKALGINPQGSKASLAERFDVSFNPNGTLKASALTSVGLASLPITDNQIADAAGIQEHKLALDYSTSDLFTLITSNTTLLNSVNAYLTSVASDLNAHIGGSPNPSLRHVASHIDLNVVPSDIRDVSYTWSGLTDKDGNARSAATVAEALDQINTDLIDHENVVSVVNHEGAHPASAISVDTSNFEELSQASQSVQDVLDNIDDSELLSMGIHRATMHSNGVPKDARSQSFVNPDGYRETVVPATLVSTFVAHNPPGTTPQDDVNVGDDIVIFSPDNTNFVFDAQFSQVRVGDVIRINYGNGLEASFYVESIRYIPGSSWAVRINGNNLFDSDGYDVYARIDRPLFDEDVYGVLAVAPANATPNATFNNTLTSVIVGHPRGATALGIGFDPNQLDDSHYNLWLELYPSGNPVDKVISLPAIDVTGNAGTTPGKYTLESVVASTNDKLRETGYNFRLIAFEYNGNFGIMLADAISGASFAIINGDNSSGTLAEGSYVKNVVGNVYAESFDALGLGFNKADIASPTYQSSFATSTAAQLPTKVIVPLKNRNYVANGYRKDTFATTYLADSDGAWPATIIDRTVVGVTTVEVTYEIAMSLEESGLKAGKTIVVQPTVDYGDGAYNDVDYGRFIIKSVNFIGACPGPGGTTQITVINGIHAKGTPVATSSGPGLAVKLFFGYDSVGFNDTNVINSSPAALDYHRLHEIYITQDGKTFSHERAQMEIQAESTSPPNLGTTYWHFHDVSPKLRGYKDTGSTAINKYIRLYILDYDSSTGEFDGYIGKKGTGDGLEKPGPITRGRKSVPVRFYDETNLDFIELEFREDGGTSPGNAVLSTNLPRYVDIEVFPSLETDDEVLLLATCEINWNPSSGASIVEHVHNKRPVGSISEKEFTQSAKDFITSGDRYLHTNGVISGLDYVGPNASDGRELFFNGGIAIVNGAVVMVNNDSATIPQVYNNLSSLPQTITWAVCVNEFGSLVPILITTSKTQIFSQDITSSTDYYVPSVTFSELVLYRKDLTPIAIVSATINSVTINSVLDARRFAFEETSNIPLTWVPDTEVFLGSTLLDGSNITKSEKIAGHFKSFDAVKTWINYYGANNNTVVIRGTHAFSDSDTLDLTGLLHTVTFRGENATIVLNADKGITFGGGVSFKDLAFVYNPATGVFDPNDFINTGAGALYALAGVDTSLQNVTIDNCSFTAPLMARGRAPFINIEINSNSLIDKLTIRNCSFSDNPNGLNQTRFAAIALVNLNDGSVPAVVANTTIEDNKCDLDQGIYLVSHSGSTTYSSPGVNASNVKIRSNLCGTIGYLISHVANTTKDYYGVSNSALVFKVANLQISDNTCKLIASCTSTGVIIISTTHTIAYGTSNVDISHNTANWIQVSARHFEIANLSISHNRLFASDTSYLTPIALTEENIAIKIDNKFSHNTNNQIISNTIDFGFENATTQYYTVGIACLTAAIISGNTIRGLESDGTNAFGINLAPIAANSSAIVSHNNIQRVSSDIRAYILVWTGKGVISDNTFDGYYVDAALTDANPIKSILYPNQDVLDKYNIHHNKNNFESITVRGYNGQVSINNILTGSTVLTSLIGKVYSDDTGLLIQYKDTSTAVSFRWDLPLINILPTGSELIEISFDIISSVALGTGTLTVYLEYPDGTTTTYVNAANITTGLVTYSIYTSNIFISSRKPPVLKILVTVDNVATADITIGNVAGGTAGVLLGYIT